MTIEAIAVLVETEAMIAAQPIERPLLLAQTQRQLPDLLRIWIATPAPATPASSDCVIMKDLRMLRRSLVLPSPREAAAAIIRRPVAAIPRPADREMALAGGERRW